MTAIRATRYQMQVKVFEAAGCTYVRTQGDHLVYRYPGALRPVIIPKYKEVPVFIMPDYVPRNIIEVMCPSTICGIDFQRLVPTRKSS